MHCRNKAAAPVQEGEDSFVPLGDDDGVTKVKLLA